MEGLYFVLLFVAVAIGYVIGIARSRRYSFRAALDFRNWFNLSTYSTQLYLKGLNQLLSEQQDKAVDTFLNALPVNDVTVETHFALGAVLRRRGQLERAIRIHQNILEAEGVPEEHKPQAHLELALDYDASGLLDRSEVALAELVKTCAGSVRTQALRHLVQIYEKEGDWRKALKTAEDLCSTLTQHQVGHWRYLQAHYSCELACDAISLSDKRKEIAKAKAFCPDHPRASLMEGQMHLEAGDYGMALQHIQVLLSSKRYLQVGTPLMLRCYRAQHTDDLALQQLVELFRQHNEIALVPLIAQYILEQGGQQAMVSFVIGALRGNHKLPYFAEVLALAEPEKVECLELQKILIKSLPFQFHCDHCGFEGAQWYWCCPACQSWM